MTVLLPVALASAELTARTVTVFELGTVAGAVNRPDELIVPVTLLPPATPFICQLTAVFEVPATAALNDLVAPARIVALAGETVTVTLDPEGGGLEFPGLELELADTLVVPVHPASAVAASRTARGGESRNANSFHVFIRTRIDRPVQ